MNNYKKIKLITALTSCIVGIMITLCIQAFEPKANTKEECVEVKLQMKRYAAACQAEKMLNEDYIKACYDKKDVCSLLKKLCSGYEDTDIYTVEINGINIEEKSMNINYVELIDSMDMERLIETGLYYEGYEALGQYEYFDELKENISYNISDDVFTYLLSEDLEELRSSSISDVENASKNTNCFEIAVCDNKVIGIVQQYLE